MGNSRVLGAFVLAGALSVGSALQAQTYPTGADPRNGLKPGKGGEAGEAAHGMKLLSLTPKAATFDSTDGLNFANSDITFGGKYVYQGNFAGFSIWDVSNPAKPELMSTVKCQTNQGDPSIYGNLLFVSAEGAGNRKDCGKDPVTDPSQHMAGVRIFDVSDPRAPKLVKNVETCKGSHTHSLLPSKSNKNILYIYVSGSGGARAENDLPGCKAGDDPADTENSLYRLDVIKVDLRKPDSAFVVTGARIFTGLGPAPRPGRAGGAGGRGAAAGAPPAGAPPAGAAAGGRGGRGGQAPAPSGPRNCHDVTIYPARDLLAGACGSYGILVDVKNPEKPVRLDAISDSTFSLWHTAVFSNDGKKVVFTDEWGGGTGPMCQATSMMQQGGNTTLEITAARKFKQRGYFKPNFAQTAQENCVSHNGGLIPVPGRDIMTQGWYQGGINLIDFSDPDKPTEIGYFDRGPIDNPPPIDAGPPSNAAGGRGGARPTTGGSWGSYYWNGYIYSSEIARGLDVVELTPTAELSANEIAAAKLVKYEQYNPQSQPIVSWPAAYPVVRSYVDQLQRKNGLAAARITAINAALDASEKQAGAARKASLSKLAAEVDKDVAGAADAPRVRTLSAEIKRLAAATK